MCQWILAGIRQSNLGKDKRENFHVTLIQVYVLMTDSADKDISKFYDQLDSAINTCKSQDIVTVMGDLNAKVGMGQENIIVGPW